MVILKSQLFSQFPEIIFGFSTKAGSVEAPYFFNLSLSVGDDPEKVKERRNNFFKALGIQNIVYQKQVHGNTIRYADKAGFAGESDALITDKPGLGLMISAADCATVYIYDRTRKIIAGVHAGWRSTCAGIVEKTITELVDVYRCSPGNMVVYIGPSISREVYEVGREVASLFQEKYFVPFGSKYLLDVSGKNYDDVRSCGVPEENIQHSGLCTFKLTNLLHSYRRDGAKSGRSVGVIAMRENI